jgi:hypothetical protein
MLGDGCQGSQEGRNYLSNNCSVLRRMMIFRQVGGLLPLAALGAGPLAVFGAGLLAVLGAGFLAALGAGPLAITK